MPTPADSNLCQSARYVLHAGAEETCPCLCRFGMLSPRSQDGEAVLTYKKYLIRLF